MENTAIKDSTTVVDEIVDSVDTQGYNHFEFRYSISTVLDTLTRLLEKLDTLTEDPGKASELKSKVLSKIEELVEKLG